MTQYKYTSTILDTIWNINYTYNPLQCNVHTSNNTYNTYNSTIEILQIKINNKYKKDNIIALVTRDPEGPPIYFLKYLFPYHNFLCKVLPLECREGKTGIIL